MLWSSEQKRLRAAWRIVIFGVLVFSLAALLFSVSILVIGVWFVFSIARAGANFPANLVYERLLGFVSDMDRVMLISSISTMVSVFLVTPFSIKVIDKREWTPLRQQLKPAWWKDLGIGCLVGFAGIGLIFAILAALGSIQVSGFNVDLAKPGFLSGFFRSLLLFVCVGVYEEVIFRGYVFNNLSESLFGKWLTKGKAVTLSAIISSLAFSILHLANPHANFMGFLNILVIGCLLCLSVLVTRRIGFAIGFHFLWNFSQSVLFSVPVSGLSPDAALLNVQVNGPDWLTGGLFGFEGSVLCLLINISAAILIVFLYKKKNKDLELNFEIAEYVPRKPSVSQSQSPTDLHI